MKRLLSTGIAACAAATLVAPTTALATSRPEAAPTTAARAAAGFTPVQLPITPRHVVSTTDGVAYVSGTTKDGKPSVMRVVRTRYDVTTQNVPLPSGVSEAPGLTTAKGHVYAYAPARGPQTTNTLLDIVGRTATALTPPPSSADMRIQTVTADTDGTLWLTMIVPDPTWNIVYRGDGHTWTNLPRPGGAAALRAYATGGHLYTLSMPYGMGGLGYAYHWDGTAWQREPGLWWDHLGWQGYEYQWTVSAPGDYTRWGFASGAVGGSPRDQATLHGTCAHVGPGPRCIATTWAVSAATRLADGRVVLGGFDGKGHGDTQVDGGFAVVPSPGATPVDLSGDNGNRVEELAAPARGTTVWAVTSTGSHEWNDQATGFTLQLAVLPKSGKLTPRPVRRTPHLPR